MYVVIKRKRAARFTFYLGLACTLSGAVFLGLPLGFDPSVSVAMASCCILLGAAFAFLSLRLHKRSSYLFFSTLLIQIGILSVLMACDLISLPFRDLWPVITIFVGLSLVPAGCYSYRGPNARFIIPSIAFILLGSILLFFSLHVVKVPLREIVLAWGPSVLLFSGVIVILAALVAQGNGEDRKP